MTDMNPLVKRVYRSKTKEKDFFCPLCRTQRNVRMSPTLTKKNYLQIVLSTIVVGTILFPLMSVVSYSVFFLIWGSFELVIRSNYKKEIPCPHCGFDATDYKKDIKVARQKVKEFWDQKQGVNVSTSDIQTKRV